MIITTTEELDKEATDIQAFLEVTITDDIMEIEQRGSDLVVYISRTGKMLADAKVHKDRMMKSEIMDNLKTLGRGANIPASTLNELIKASCVNENYLVNWLERLNRSATHQLDWCRTLISKAKEEMKYS